MTEPRAKLWLLLAGLAIVTLTALAWWCRFALDDAFISLRYAEHLAAGHGLVWNAGEAVEGYTNFLWTALLAIPFLVGLDPLAFAQGLGLLCFALTLAATWRLARHLLPGPAAAFAALGLLGTSFTALAYATSGLEASMQAMWLTTAAALVAGGLRDGRARWPRALLLSLALAAAVLTRLDSAVVGVWLGVTGLVLALRAGPARARLAALAALVLPFVALVGAWLAWKWVTYGELLPNTFYAKAASEPQLLRGLGFLWLFATEYMLPVVLLLLALHVPRLRQPGHRPLALLLAALLAWWAYVAWVGGDFMELRFVVATLPLFYVLVVWVVLSQVTQRLVQVALVLLLLVGSAHHALTFTHRDGVESIAELSGHLDAPAQDWAGIGRFLGETFAADRSVAIATTAAGAIPYYSKLPTVDMLGLTDPWIAQNGRAFGAQLGHERIAPVRYLVARQVHLVLGQPWLRRPSPPQRAAYEFAELRELRVFAGEAASEFPPSTSMLEIPLDAERSLVAVYLVPHPAVEALIQTRGWRRFPIRVPGPDAVL